MQMYLPFLEGGDRAEREESRRISITTRFVSPEPEVEPDQQWRFDEVRELVSDEALDHSRASAVQDAPEADQETCPCESPPERL